MYRPIAFALMLAAFISAPVFGQTWAENMFNETKHNFGTVASNSDAVHKFEVKNIYNEEIEILSVSSSCGCTTPSIENNKLATWDKGYIVARFNTNTFRGQRGANLTVRVAFRKPDGSTRTGTVNLRVDGVIRSDLQFSPGIASFDTVDQGTAKEKRIAITYTGGRNDWKIEDVKAKTDRDFYEVELTETGRQYGRASYELLVRLKDNAPAGYLRDELYLVTNDSSMKRVPLDIEGKVNPEISVSPAQLILGEVSKTEPITKTLVVRGKKPFKITSFDCEEGCFRFEADKDSKETHLVKITFDACETPEGRVQKAIQINTDRGEHIAATLTAYATVVAGKPVVEGAEPGSAVVPAENTEESKEKTTDNGTSSWKPQKTVAGS